MTELNVVKISLEDYLELRDEIRDCKIDLEKSYKKYESKIIECNIREEQFIELAVERFLQEYPSSSYEHFNEDGIFITEHSWVQRDLNRLATHYKIDRVNLINKLRKEVKENENE